MKTAAHVAANILAIGALSVAAGSAQKSGDGGGTRTSPVALDTTVPRHSLAIRASRNEDRWLPPTTTTTSAPSAPPAKARASSSSGGSVPSSGHVKHVPAPGNDKAFIYNHESTNNPCAYYPRKSDCNYTGHAACGLGGANPCDKLRVVCLLSDYACQDDWFTNRYMIPRYGTWANAKAHWVATGWW